MQELYDLPERDRVCRAFASAAYLTWSELRDFSQLEEGSITDYRLLQLKRMCPEEVTVIKFSKPQEAKTGADWEWWFGSGDEWFGMRVQAKRLNVTDLEYSHLDHVIGRTGVRQVDRLVDDATTRSLYPMYCFYNFWNVATGVEWRCRTFAQKTELWGAAVADAKRVRQRIDRGAKSLSDINQVSMPLMCLACCRGHADNRTNPTLPHRARGIASYLCDDRQAVPPLVPHPPWYTSQQAIKITGDLPAGVADLDGILVVEERPAIYEEAGREWSARNL